MATAVEWINAVASMITALAVSAGVVVAWRQLGSWRKEARTKNKAAVAEQVILSANEADDALRYIRGLMSPTAPESERNRSGYEWRHKLDRLLEKNGTFEELRRAQIRARSILAIAEVDAALSTFFEIRNEVFVALGTLASRRFDEQEPRETKQFYGDLQWKAWGTYTEEDELGARQLAALKTIEAHLYKLLQLNENRA